MRACARARAFTLLKTTPFTHFHGVTQCSEPLTVCRSSYSSLSSRQLPGLHFDSHSSLAHTDAHKTAPCTTEKDEIVIDSSLITLLKQLL